MVDRPAAEIAASAEGNLKSKNLTKDSGMVFTYLYDGPLIEHLREGEQPEYVFSNENKGYRITDRGGTEETPHHIGSEGKRYIILTDQRILYVAGCKDGDESIEHGYDQVTDISVVGSSNLEFHTVDGTTYKFAQAGSTKQTVSDAVDYGSERIEAADQESVETQTDKETVEPGTEDDDQTAPDDSAADDGPTQDSTKPPTGGLSNIDLTEIRNSSVPANISEIDDDIKTDETVHFAYQINAAERGDDKMGGLTTGGCLLATDGRLTAYINETIGSSNLSINYDQIDTVEIEHGAMITKLSVQSTSKTYSFPGFNSIDKTEIHDFADFIRNRAEEANADTVTESTIDPTEQLKNIKELHDQGVLSDDEFEEKKQTLLDKL